MAAAAKKITCSHKTHLILSTDTKTRFPIRTYAKKLKEQGKIFKKDVLLKLVDLYKVWPPQGSTELHKCEQVTVYRISKSSNHFIHKT